MALVLASLLAWSSPRIRNLAEELPDVLAPAEPPAPGAPEMQAEPLG